MVAERFGEKQARLVHVGQGVQQSSSKQEWRIGTAGKKGHCEKGGTVRVEDFQKGSWRA